jgi:hypothetical protein
MPTTDRSNANSRGQRAAQLLLLAGVASIFASLVWSTLPLHRVLWSDAQARQYQEVSARLHDLAHRFGDQPTHGDPRSVVPELEQAQKEYDRLRHHLDAARNEPAQMSSVLFWGGVLLSVVGGAIYFTNRY